MNALFRGDITADDDTYQLCAYYFDNLGLDHRHLHYAAIGDKRANSIQNSNYRFSITPHQKATSKQINPKIRLDSNITANIEGTVFKDLNLNYSSIYDDYDFDPSI